MDKDLDVFDTEGKLSVKSWRSDENMCTIRTMEVWQIMNAIRDVRPETRLEAVKQCHLQAMDNEVFIDEIISADILPILVQCLMCTESSGVQYGAASTLMIITAGSTKHTIAVVDADAVPALVQLLKSPHNNVLEAALKALGNIICESLTLRDLTIRHGVIEPLLSLVNSDIPDSLLKLISWAMMNLCKDINSIFLDTIQKLLQVLNVLITCSDIHYKVLKNTAWAISNLADTGTVVIKEVINSNILPKLTRLITHKDVRVQAGALRAVGNIAVDTDEHTQVLLDCDLLSHLSDLLSLPVSELKLFKEALWILSNIAAGNAKQRQALMDSGLLPRVAENLRRAHLPTQKEAAWIVNNISTGGSKDQMAALVGSDVLPPFCDLLGSENGSLLEIVLNGLESILKKAGPDLKWVTRAVEACGGLDRLEAVQRNDDDEIYEKAYLIIKLYFGGVDENVLQ